MRSICASCAALLAGVEAGSGRLEARAVERTGMSRLAQLAPPARRATARRRQPARSALPTSQVPSPWPVTAIAAVRAREVLNLVAETAQRRSAIRPCPVRDWVAEPSAPVTYRLRTEAEAICRPARSKATALMTEVPASMPMRRSAPAFIP